MPYRTFEDSAGAEWRVWDIVPRLSERRVGTASDRRVEIKAISFADRRREQRRTPQAPVARARLRGTYAQGWLCFENDYEKRRLSPIPDDWTTCDDDRLEEYARTGERVVTSQPFYYRGDEPFAEAG
ncbi:MAG: hypothetical protein ACREOK_05835 [Gemmatimonadaceae bacterium]